MNKKETPIHRYGRYLLTLASQFTKHYFYSYFWIIGTLLFAALFQTITLWGWGACAIFSLFTGSMVLCSKIAKVEKALESIPLNYPDTYGKPRWIVDEKCFLNSDILRITSGGFTANDFQPFIGQLAVRLEQPIREIRQPLASSRILEIVLKRSDVPRILHFSELSLNALAQGEFYVGKNDVGLEKLSLAKMTHMLVAGQTGGGKTQFLKQFMATILSHTRYSHVMLIDMKGGIDFQNFSDLPNFEMATTYEKADALLDAVIELYDQRISYLLKKKKEKWTEFNYKDIASDESLKGKPTGPVVVVVDELAELSRKATKSAANSELQEKLASIARLARSTGIHLVLGTQRPDKRVIDMQGKANLQTRVCFAVTSVTDSNIVIGNMMASTIGKNPGRAVFQNDGTKVLQTPLISNSDLDALLIPTKAKLEAKTKVNKLLAAESGGAVRVLSPIK